MYTTLAFLSESCGESNDVPYEIHMLAAISHIDPYNSHDTTLMQEAAASAQTVLHTYTENCHCVLLELSHSPPPSFEK